MTSYIFCPACGYAMATSPDGGEYCLSCGYRPASTQLLPPGRPIDMVARMMVMILADREGNGYDMTMTNNQLEGEVRRRKAAMLAGLDKVIDPVKLVKMMRGEGE